MYIQYLRHVALLWLTGECYLVPKYTLIESVSEGFLTYPLIKNSFFFKCLFVLYFAKDLILLIGFIRAAYIQHFNIQ